MSDRDATQHLSDRIAAVEAARVAAIDDSGGRLTYGELRERADALLGGMGSTPRLVLLEGRNSLGWLIAYVACLRGGHPVLLAPGGNQAAFDGLRETFQPAMVLTSANGFRLELIADAPAPALHPELALLLSTSGSTGSAKCVRLSRANITANAASIADYLRIGGDEHGVVSLPTHYSYGLSIVNSHLWAGATLLLTEHSMIDDAFWGFCAAESATSFAGVPHSYDLLSRLDLAARSPASLRYFTQAGGRLPEAQARQFAELAKAQGWRFYVMYGQTEATARMAYLPPDLAIAKAGCIGQAIPGGRFALIDENGAEIARADLPGELVYHGPNVMMGYATTPNDLAAAPGPPELRTGDLAQRDADGLYRITGRLSRFVKIFGNRIGLDDVERLLAAAGHAAIATGIDDQLLIVTRESSEAVIAALIEARLKLPTDYFTVRRVADYPLLSSGKIDYASLKSDLTTPAQRAETGGARTVRGAFALALGDEARDEAMSFAQLGGDSLHYVALALVLERMIGQLPDDWSSLSIGALSDMAEAAVARGLVAPGSMRAGDQDDFLALLARPAVSPPLPDGGSNMNPPGLSFWALVAEDYRTNDSGLFHQGFQMLFVHRFGNWRMSVRPKLLRAPLTILYRFLNKMTQILFGMKLDYTVKVGRRVKLEHFGGMILGARAIGNDVVLRQNTTMGVRSVDDVCGKPTIGDFVDIGAGAVIAGNVTIGENAIIGANSVIFTDVPPNAIVMGVPAKVIGLNRRRNRSPLSYARDRR